MLLQLSWSEHSPDKREVRSSSLRISIIWGYSSVGRAFEWHSKGLEFDSRQLHLYGSVAQRLMHLTVYQNIVGLSPIRVANLLVQLSRQSASMVRMRSSVQARLSAFICKRTQVVRDSADNAADESSNLSACIKYGVWDCWGWSPVLHTGYQIGSNPICSTIYTDITHWQSASLTWKKWLVRFQLSVLENLFS